MVEADLLLVSRNPHNRDTRNKPPLTNVRYACCGTRASIKIKVSFGCDFSRNGKERAARRRVEGQREGKERGSAKGIRGVARMKEEG